MTNDYNANRSFSDRFLPEIKSIVMRRYVITAPFEEDVKRNTDLMVLSNAGVRIACRVRNYSYYDSFRHQFTIRSHSKYGGKTEIDKVREGWGDCMFYGFVNQAKTALHSWTMIDLNVFRNYEKLMLLPETPNTDSTRFLAFDYDDFPPKLIIARSCNAY